MESGGLLAPAREWMLIAAYSAGTAAAVEELHDVFRDPFGLTEKSAEWDARFYRKAPPEQGPHHNNAVLYQYYPLGSTVGEGEKWLGSKKKMKCFRLPVFECYI